MPCSSRLNMLPPPTKLLATGLLCSLSLFQTALSAAIPRQEDDPIPLASIAIKLSPTALQTRSDLSGAQLVESLVLKAQNATTLSLSKRSSPNIKVLPLITSIPPSELASMVQRATALDPTYQPTDFSTWYQVHLDTPATARPALLANLNLDPSIATSQTLLSPSPPSILRLRNSKSPPSPNTTTSPPNPTVTDPLFPSQGHLHPAPLGINAPYAWLQPGGTGLHTTIADIERGWHLTHPDLPPTITLLAGMNVRDRYNANLPHGTAVLGTILMAPNNTLGGVGVAPDASGYVVGIQRTVDGGPRENQAEAILDAARVLHKGDVMLLEMQAANEAGSLLYPVEILDAQYEAIRLATALGIVVVEPAGNGDQETVGADLDAGFRRGEVGEDGVEREFLKRGSSEFRDSGAIMVAAATSGVPHGRMGWSNFGERVDVYSWGEGIWTASVVPEEDDRETYVGFGGTSGAAPIVAGAVLSVQGMRAAAGKEKLTSVEMRRVIKMGGTPSADPKGDRIGVQPDLKAIIDGGYLW